jgi:glycosyltransferase involved in cell wall biosynthesis
MIVKDEAHVICRCLESVKPLIDSWLIVDTGSTDGTQDIIREFLKDIPGELHERPWVNFAHNRNEALELARDKADYLLFMDADDILTYAPNYVRPETFDKEGYYLKIYYSGTTYDRVQLINTQVNWRWEGVVHEVIYYPDVRNCGYLDGVVMKIIGGGGRSQDQNKFLKDIAMLEDDLEKNPNNARSVFYLAQSYRDGNFFEKAIELYETRVEMGGWDEEVFWSLYQIAALQERLGKDRETVLAAYSRAFNYRPSRAEPMYRIASYQRRQGYPYHAYLIANLGMKIPLPRDLIFVESWIYDFGLGLEYALCCHQLKRYEECFNTCLALLSNPRIPDDIRKGLDHILSMAVQAINQSRAAKAG